MYVDKLAPVQFCTLKLGVFWTNCFKFSCARGECTHAHVGMKTSQTGQMLHP